MKPLHKFSKRVRVQTDFPEGEGLTKQEFKNDCNLNVIMNRMAKTGQVPQHIREGTYGDLTRPTDLHAAMNLVAEAKSLFETVPAPIRDEFDNDMSKYLDFVQNPENAAKAEELGIGLSPEAQKAAAELQPQGAEPAASAPAAEPEPSKGE